jgi:hypothetical protein
VFLKEAGILCRISIEGETERWKNMYWETLPDWFWFVYYLFFFTSFGTALSCLVKRRRISFAFLVFILVFTIPVLGLLNGIERGPDLNEAEHLLQSLLKGEIWSIYIAAGYVALLIWWIFFIKGIFERNSKKCG